MDTLLAHPARLFAALVAAGALAGAICAALGCALEHGRGRRT